MAIDLQAAVADRGLMGLREINRGSGGQGVKWVKLKKEPGVGNIGSPGTFGNDCTASVPLIKDSFSDSILASL